MAGFLPVVAENFVESGLALRDRPDYAGGIEEVSEIEIGVNRITAPAATPHGQRERHAVVERTARSEAMSLVNDDTAGG